MTTARRAVTPPPAQTISGLRAQRAQKMTKLRQLEWRWERNSSSFSLTHQLAQTRQAITDLEEKILVASLGKDL